MQPLRLVVVGTCASNPYAGMAWMTMQIAGGLLRLGHDVYYMELTSDWPYDPLRQTKVRDSEYALPYLAGVAESFGLHHRWAYRRSYSDKEWFGLSKAQGEEVLANADAVLNVTGATPFAEEQLKVGRLVYFGTDPVVHELAFANRDKRVEAILAEHDDVVTYGENIGTPYCPVPPLPRLRATTRQPVLLDHWTTDAEPTRAFTTVGNWRQVGLDIAYQGETYSWSKHHEFLKFKELPKRVGVQLELATNLGARRLVAPGSNESVPALGVQDDEMSLFEKLGWRFVDGPAVSRDPWSYRDYIRTSRGEFTVARDLNVRLRSGWFSERSACYLAAGRPVITQDTGFGRVLPTGEGLFAFSTMEDIVAAFDRISSDYRKHSRAARSIAREYFRAETVLEKLLRDLGY
jgi:hypothetical protein